MIESPRISRFSKNWTDEGMDRIIAIAAEPVSFTGSDAVVDGELLYKALRGFFLPDSQIRHHLRTLVSVARSHAESHFPSDSMYLSGLYDPSPWGRTKGPALCLTGLAGVGKSDLLYALARLLAEDSKTSVAGHTRLPLVALWHLTMQQGPGLSDLLRPYVDPAATSPADEPPGLGHSPKKRPHIQNLLGLARKIAWRDAVCLLLIDELQFMAHGSDSYASILAFLLRVLELGPRPVFCANFSLVHKLKRRNQEHQDRFLARPLILHPPARDSADWIAYLTTAKSVAPEVLTFDPAADASEIHQYTYGIKRSFVELVTIAFRLTRTRYKRGTVGMNEILSAYRSLDYATYRANVEVLQRQAIEGRMVREDLWCPLTALDLAHTAEETGCVSPAKQAIAAFEQRIDEKLLDESLTPEEATAVIAMEPQAARSRQSGAVIPIRGRKATKADLLAGARVLEGL